MGLPAQDHVNDGALVLAVQQGDVGAFDALFRRHYGPVHRACRRRLGDPLEADEVAQAAFVRALERIDQCAGDRRFAPWVHAIARSMCTDAFRARARVEPYEEPPVGRRELRTNEPEESLLRGERVTHVQAALAALPERQRSAVIARDCDELRPGEIADRLGLSVGAVDSLLLRARRRLALSYRRLAGEGGGGASTRTLRAAACAAGVAFAAGPQAVMTATAAAASAVHDTAGRAAAGVVSAAVTVALTLGGMAPADAPAPPPPAPITSGAASTGARPAEPAPAPASNVIESRAPSTPGITLPGEPLGAASPPALQSPPPAAVRKDIEGPALSGPTTTSTVQPSPAPIAGPASPAPAPVAGTTGPAPPAAAPIQEPQKPPAVGVTVDPKVLGLPPIPVTVPPVLPLPLGLGGH